MYACGRKLKIYLYVLWAEYNCVCLVVCLFVSRGSAVIQENRNREKNDVWVCQSSSTGDQQLDLPTASVKTSWNNMDDV